MSISRFDLACRHAQSWRVPTFRFLLPELLPDLPELLPDAEAVVAGRWAVATNVKRGKAADLVLLDRNPLTDIAATRTIRGVAMRGKFYDRAALDAMLAGVRRTVASFPRAGP